MDRERYELTIPLELFRPIFENISDSHTLYNLCLLSSVLRSEAERVLYRSYTAKYIQPQHLQFLKALNNNPRLPPLVRCYHIQLDRGRMYSNDIISLINGALQNMVNLTELSVDVSAKHRDAVPLDLCPFQLRRMAWQDRESMMDKMFIEWLEMQKELQHLEWICLRKHHVDPSACPNLASFRGNPDAMYAILPGRKIKRLEAVSIPLLERERSVNYDPISPELENLQSLCVEMYLRPPDFISLMNHSFLSLEHLELFELCTVPPASLNLPPNLKILIFTFRIQSLVALATIGAINTFFGRCQHLQHVDLAILQLSSTYTRWVSRDGSIQEERRDLTWEECH